MITYFIKSGLCLALLLAFYHFVLEREKMHKFNRFYLLGSVLFSFLAPLYIIYEYIPVVAETYVPTMVFEEAFVTEETIVEESFNYTPYLIGLYAVISLLLLIRFSKNLFLIIFKIRKNRHLQLENATIVLVEDAISPHTFWNYIFINKDEYFSEKVEDELFTHELAHVTQKHTIDILFIEFLQVLFWINPTFIFLKKAIKLNHEFLADNKVLSIYKNTTEYQYLLLNRATWNNEYYLASNLNYLLTKKRLQMMTKKSSRMIILLKKLAIFPLLVGFVFLFAERVTAQEKADPKVVSEYNKLAKKYNNQKLNAEEYPNIPPPPPPVVKNGKIIKGDFAPPSPPKPIKVKKGVKYNGDIPSPPPLPEKNMLFQNINENSKQSISEPVKIEIEEKVIETVGLQPGNVEQVEIEELVDSQSDVEEQVEIQETKPKTGWLYVNNQTLYYVKDKKGTTYYNRWGQKVDKTGKIINAEQTKSDEVIPNQNISKVYKNNKVAVEFKRNNLPEEKNIDRVDILLSPPRPISPLDFMKERKDKNADYFYNGKKINYKKAIEFLKTKRPIQIITERTNGKIIVNLTKDVQKKISPLDSVPKNKKYIKQVPEESSNTPEKGWVYYNKRTYYYVIKNGKTTYYDRNGKIVDLKLSSPFTNRAKKKVSSLDSIPTKTGWEQVGANYYAYKIFNGKKYYFDKDSDKQVAVKHPEPEDYDVMMQRIKNSKKQFYIENKRVSKAVFKKTQRGKIKYYYTGFYTNGNKIFKFHASKSKSLIEKIAKSSMKKGYSVSTNQIQILNPNSRILNDKGLTYYLDGKLVAKNDLNKIDVGTMQSIKVEASANKMLITSK